jgi:hypothetical protein
VKIETLEVAGFAPAMTAMRNPLNSWAKNDSAAGNIGPNDKDLSVRLQKAGPEHCKHLRMIQVWADIEAPREWLIQLDTYRFGVEKISCSTMHKLTSRDFEPDDFDMDFEIDKIETANWMNEILHAFKEEQDIDKKNFLWRRLIQNLPQSYIQRRTYMFSYAALRNIVKQREGHKLHEWAQFIGWVHTLPNSWMIFE